MRLQEVLKEREAEISALEDNLRDHNSSPPRPVTPLASGFAVVPEDLRNSTLSPSTMSQFNEIRKAVAPNGDAVEHTEAAESLGRLDELMRYALHVSKFKLY